MIESEETPQAALPVRERKLYVMPFNYPVIERLLNADVEEDASADPRITMTSTLVIQGRQLRGQITRVRIGSIFRSEEHTSELQSQCEQSRMPSSA